MNILLEALSVGVLAVIVGSVVGFTLSKLFSNNLPKICKQWNKNHIMELSLFLTGFAIHLLCEISGINKWYCVNGNACKKR